MLCLSRKERDHFLIKAIFSQAKSESELRATLKEAGFEIYVRGNNEGVLATDGRKYRLRTLALESDALSARKRIKLFESRRQDIEKSTNYNRKLRERS